MSETPWQEEGDAFTATFKSGNGFEDPWLVLRAGSANILRDRVVEAFGLDGDGDGLTLIESIHNANQTFHALGSLGRELGGRVVSQEAASSQAKAEQAGDDPWIAAEAASNKQEQADPDKKLLDEIEAATSVDQLKRFWVANNPLSEAVETAWRAKGRSLS